MSGCDDYDLDYAWEAQCERRREAALAQHPACHDPDHPGCPSCADSEEDDQ